MGRWPRKMESMAGFEGREIETKFFGLGGPVDEWSEVSELLERLSGEDKE